MLKNGRDQYIEINDDVYYSYDWEEDDEFFYLYGVRFQNDNDGPLLAKIRLNAINGYYFE
jgi:hypothetical protein